MLKGLYWLILVFILFTSCKNESNFLVHDSGLKYKILKESESEIVLRNGDFIELNLKYKTENDSVLFNSEEFGSPFKMQVSTPTHLGGSFELALSLMNPGDRYQFLILADSFYLKTKQEQLPIKVQRNSELLFDIHVIRKISAEEIKRERELLEKQMKEQEQIILQQYIEDNEIKQLPSESGLYYVEIEAGVGKKAKTGDVLTVHYTGKLINGNIFDSSYNRNETFTFKLGSEEVIQGWEEGFSNMRKGGKAIFIIPSVLAYSNEGYSSIIQPYTSLVFDVELLDIKNK